jgi:hypothetical protein
MTAQLLAQKLFNLDVWSQFVVTRLFMTILVTGILLSIIFSQKQLAIAKFEEEIDTPKVEPKPVQKQARKSKVTRKRPTSGANEDKPVSKLHDELRKHSDARKKAEREILDIRRELKDLLLSHHATIKVLQKQVAQMHRKITTIDSSRKSIRSKTTSKKTASSKKIARNNKTSSKKSRKKSGQKNSRNR